MFASIFSLSYVGTISLALIICFLTWHLWQRRPRNSPPGTNGFPLFGVMLSLGRYTERTVTKWAKQYGPIYMIKVGTHDVVVITSPEIAYEAYAKSDFFNDRPQSIALFSDKKGIVFVDKSDFFNEQRRFGLNTLRLFGMGRRTLEPRLIELSNNLCDKIDEFSGQSLDPERLIYELLSSVISCMIFGYDISAEDEQFKKLLDTLTDRVSSGFLAGIILFAPFLKHIFPFSYVWNIGNEIRVTLHKEIGKEIEKHLATLDLKNPRDFIDCFLIEMDKFEREAQSNQEERKNNRKSSLDAEDPEDDDFSSDWKRRSSFGVEQLAAVVRDIYVAGIDTTANTLLWLQLYLCLYPEIQKKMQDEIDEVLGPSGHPKMALAEKMPYVRAVIQEVLRLRPLAPLAVPHKASKDALLRGYRIPKGAFLLTNIWGVHHDEKHWPGPEKFRPERHLNENGKLQKSDYWIPFNVGGRSCLGQQLANMELFLTTIILFRRFQISFEPGFVPNMEGESAVVLRPLPFKICAQQR